MKIEREATIKGSLYVSKDKDEATFNGLHIEKWIKTISPNMNDYQENEFVKVYNDVEIIVRQIKKT